MSADATVVCTDIDGDAAERTATALGANARSARLDVTALCAALLHLIEQPKCTAAELVTHVPGPDFPTGGVLVESPDSIAEAYATGRGSFRLRAR